MDGDITLTEEYRCTMKYETTNEHTLFMDEMLNSVIISSCDKNLLKTSTKKIENYEACIEKMQESRILKDEMDSFKLMDNSNVLDSVLLNSIKNLESDNNFLVVDDIPKVDLNRTLNLLSNTYVIPFPELNRKIKEQIQGKPRLPKIEQTTIGGYSRIEKMVELSYKNDIKRKHDMAEQIGYLKQLSSSWRSVGGDGNCFYRSVIFGLLEHSVFTKNIEYLIHIMSRIDSCLTKENPKLKNIPLTIQTLYTEINKKIIISIINIIIRLLETNNIIDAYITLVNSFNYSNIFDFGLICYLRYEIYDFLYDNQTKMYSKEFAVLLGNLLPAQYEKSDGSFDFNNYFVEELLKLYTCAEKIVIYVAPFAVKCNIKLLMFEYGLECNIQTKHFNCLLPNKPEICLLYRKCHYDLAYLNEFSLKYEKLLFIYGLNEKLMVVNQQLIEYYIENEVQKINFMDSKVFNKKQKMIEKSKKDSEILKQNKLELPDKNQRNKDSIISDENEKKKNYPKGIAGNVQNNNTIIVQQADSSNLKQIQISRSNTKISSTALQAQTTPTSNGSSNVANIASSISQKIEAKQQIQPKPINCARCRLVFYPFKEALICDLCMKSQYKVFMTKHKSTNLKIKELYDIKMTQDQLQYCKLNLCGFCNKILDQKNKITRFPCGCQVCTDTCRGSFCKLISSKISSQYNFILCNCCEIVKVVTLKNFCIEQGSSNDISYLKGKLILEYFHCKFLSHCMFCGEEKQQNLERVNICDVKMLPFFGTSSLYHAKCQKCSAEGRLASIFECKICEIIHHA